LSVTISGLKQLNINIKEFTGDMDKAVDDAVRITAAKVQRTAIKTIRNPSMGTYVTRYTAGGKPYSHVAAKEGESPNTDTGRLIGSISMDHLTGKKVAYVGTNVDYGFFLETVQNRPWLQPSLNQEIAGFKINMTRAVQMQIKKA
tara:strand:+ start:1778 stop:2212 length:435 start_codon:yes stop_codon:yes gene_type:complete